MSDIATKPFDWAEAEEEGRFMRESREKNILARKYNNRWFMVQMAEEAPAKAWVEAETKIRRMASDDWNNRRYSKSRVTLPPKSKEG